MSDSFFPRASRSTLPLEQATDDFFRAAVAGSVDPVVVTTPDLESPGPTIVYVNAAFERMTGYSAEEIVGKSPRMLQGPGTDHRTLQRLKADLLAGREFEGSTTNYRKDGGEYQVEWRVSGVYDGERLLNWVAIQRDVTDRWRLERALQASREGLEERVEARTADLRDANAELEAFCHTVGHDFRNPIRNIIVRSRLALEDFGHAMPEEAADHLRRVGRNAERLAELADDLLEYARLGRREVDRSPVDLTAMAKRLGDEFAASPRGGGASFDIEEGLTAEADLRLVELALRNLLENSCKYSKEAVRIEVGRCPQEGEAAFFVRDDGIGFDMAYAHKLFQPFERLHGNSGIDGTGIGLANVRRIVERHGGRIWADSAPGRGSTFWFTLG